MQAPSNLGTTAAQLRQHGLVNPVALRQLRSAEQGGSNVTIAQRLHQLAQAFEQRGYSSTPHLAGLACVDFAGSPIVTSSQHGQEDGQRPQQVGRVLAAELGSLRNHRAEQRCHGGARECGTSLRQTPANVGQPLRGQRSGQHNRSALQSRQQPLVPRAASLAQLPHCPERIADILRVELVHMLDSSLAPGLPDAFWQRGSLAG
mmetsp:Transcript_54602/g.151483  ORF Transcript_54602/g.151483 Transcript_54602/m.151483 type:complete len:204 (-) Transcript_54602:377-988(-)